MTKLLEETLADKAAQLPPPGLDAQAIITTGRCRAARRRNLAVGLSTGVVALAAALVPLVGPESRPGGRASDDPGRFAAAFAAHDPSYAVGSIVHIDGRSFDVGHRVRAMVQTGAGIVFTDPSGAVYAADGSGVAKVGTSDDDSSAHLLLVADADSVAWVDPGDDPRFVVLDQSTGEQRSVPMTPGPAGSEFRPRPLALDGATLYAVDGRGVIALDVATGAVSQTSLHGAASFLDVKNGVAITRLNQGGHPGRLVADELTVGDRTVPLTRVLGGQSMVLSPDGSKAVVELDPNAQLVDTANTTGVLLKAPGYAYATGYQWRDNQSFFAIGLKSTDGDVFHEPIDLLECQVATASCTTVVTAAGTAQDLAVPLGIAFERP